MSDTGNLFKQLTGPIDNLFKTLDSDKIVSSVLSLFLVLYGGMAAPKLPMSIAKLFKNTIFKLLIMSLIVYMTSKDTATSILIVVAFVISLQTLTYQEAKMALKKKKEAFTEYAKATTHKCKKNNMKRGCTTCNNEVRLRRPKRLQKENFSNSCSSTSDPYTIAKDVRHSRINELNLKGIEFAKKNSGKVHGNQENLDENCSNEYGDFKPVDVNSAECKNNDTTNSPSTASVEKFDNTCTTVDGAYAMVAKEGRQIQSVTSASEWQFAKNDLNSEGEKITNPNLNYPLTGASAKKVNLIKGVSENGNLHTWDLKERGISNYGCNGAPQDLTNDGRWNSETDLVKAEEIDGIEYGKNPFNSPSTMDWDANTMGL
jgi:hypothetical protein